MRVEFQFDPLRDARAYAVMIGFERQAHAAGGEMFIAKVEAHEFDIVRQCLVRHMMQRYRQQSGVASLADAGRAVISGPSTGASAAAAELAQRRPANNTPQSTPIACFKGTKPDMSFPVP